MDMDRTGVHFDRFPCPCPSIGPFAIDADGGIDGGDLVYCAEEVRKNGFNFFFGRSFRAGGDDLALFVIGRGARTEGDGEAVDLAGIHFVEHRLGGIAQRQREHAACERVERTCMADAFGAKQVFYFAHRLVGTNAQRLVQIDPAMDGNARYLRFIHGRDMAGTLKKASI